MPSFAMTLIELSFILYTINDASFSDRDKDRFFYTIYFSQAVAQA